MNQSEIDSGHHIGWGVNRHCEEGISNPRTKHYGKRPPAYELEQEPPVYILPKKSFS